MNVYSSGLFNIFENSCSVLRLFFASAILRSDSGVIGVKAYIMPYHTSFLGHCLLRKQDTSRIKTKAQELA